MSGDTPKIKKQTPPLILILGESAAGGANGGKSGGARGAPRAERLCVSVPSHCVLLESAAQRLGEAASKVRIEAPRIAYIGNRGARVLRRADAIREDLATNLRYPVRWHESTIALAELGAKVFVEMPPGQTLTQLAAEALPDAASIAMDAAPAASVAARVRAACRRATD